MDGLLIRALAAADIPAALALCRDAGWNQTADDWQLFLRLAPETCCAGCVDGRLVGTVTVLPYGPFAWIGMVLVERRSRGQGIGTALLHEALRLVGPEGTAGLDATPLGRPLYEGLGFRAVYDVSRLQCNAVRAAAGEGGSQYRWGARPLTHTASKSVIVRPLRADDLEAVRRWDADVFGADRMPLLSHCLQHAPDLAWFAESGRSPAGYLLGRRGHNFDHFGPLVARDSSIAAMLVIAALSYVNRRVVIDVPLEQRTFRDWLRSRGFHVQRPFTRMVRGSLTHVACPDALFGLFGPEFG